MKVKKITFNWYQCGSTADSDGAGEDWSRYVVGLEGVLEIIENEPNNPFEQWNYLVKMRDGSAIRIFNPNTVEYLKTEN